ncbi:UBAP1-MVB12-associated (UMA)-domain containing protein 1 isoform X4 [Lontra canadensis]|uniref:UBAP1-MVB12-associated (UMA)-domain containing protein 1 isoform X4 n=1 Tax=Lontra canadensis TaxID=76717 RepID=UPI0013F2C17D|nr:UBAP1-MVB12-associated (UMA)-domain containing protein 1 isoform X4 [Lontra canadensis]
MLALTRDLGNSMTSTMVAVIDLRPAGNRRLKFCAPRRLWGRRCRHQSAETRSLTPPIKSSEISIEIAQSQKWTEQGGLFPEVGIGCLVTHGVPEVAHVLRGGGSGGGAWMGRGSGCLPRSPGLPARLDPGSRVLGSCAVAARDCGASLKEIQQMSKERQQKVKLQRPKAANLWSQPSPQCSADVSPLVRLTKSSLTTPEEAFREHLQLGHLEYLLSAKPHYTCAAAMHSYGSH